MWFRSRTLLALACCLLIVAGLLFSNARVESKPVPAIGVSAPVFSTAIASGTSPRADSVGIDRAKANSPTSIKLVDRLREGTENTSPFVSSTTDNTLGLATLSGTTMPSPLLSFDGLSNFDNIDAYNLLIMPPDMNGDVGPNHYVQTTNALVRIFNKNGTPASAPFRMSSLFAPLNTVCSLRDDGLPVVLYDPLADRWLLSQYCNAFPPFRQMVAVSKTGDPAGQYHIYEFAMPNVRIHDLPKFGVWPDGYYMSSEEFIGSDFSGMGAFAFDRAKMLAGDPTAGLVYFSLPRQANSPVRLGNVLPADLDGLRAPPIGTPNLFLGYLADEYGQAFDGIRVYEFRVNFADPLLSTFTERPESPWEVTEFDPTSPPERTDIAQPPPGEFLDSNADRLSYRLSYRNLGTTESLVAAQTVRVASNPYRAGVRVYQLKRNIGGQFAVTEQSTIGTPDASRWIGAAAQDHQGNIAVGYNFASEQKRPSILYTGRLATEPAGTFRSEAFLVEGTGVQKAFGWRWGDYSGLVVDPIDDCTFWKTGEYYTLASETFSDFTWLSRIGTFKFDECTPTPRASISGTVTNSTTGAPIPNAVILSYPYQRTTSGSGSYGPINLLPGTAEVTASARGYRTASSSVTLANGENAVRNFALVPVPEIELVSIEYVTESCRRNNAAEPGETVTVDITLRNVGSIPTQNLRGSILPINGITAPSADQFYGQMAPGGAAVTRRFTFTVQQTVTCGSPLILPIAIFDGFLSYPIVQIPITTGERKIAFAQNFDRTPQAALPVRWTRSATGTGVNWRASAARSQSGSKSAFSPDPINVGLNEMQTPVFTMTTAVGRLTFRNWYEFETTFLRNRLYDGSVLEIKIGDGEWQDIIVAGGVFESGGYDGMLDACCQNPLAGRQGWSGRSGIEQTSSFITTAVRLPQSTATQRIQLRWRVGTDIGGFREGQYIDDLVVTDGFTCGCVSP